MNPDTMQLKELAPDEALPEGFVKLPDELQPAAESLVKWAKERPTSTAMTRAKRKRERQNRCAGRARR